MDDHVSHLTYTFTVPKPLILSLRAVDLMGYAISALLHLLGLYPSFQPIHYPWEDHLFMFFTNPESTSSGNPHPPPPYSLLSVVSDVKSQLPAIEFAKISSAAEDEDDDDDDDDGMMSCAVCLSEFEGKEEVREMGKCRHVFHMECIDEWVERGKLTCPLCRSQLLPDKGEERIGFTVKFRRKFWGLLNR